MKSMLKIRSVMGLLALLCFVLACSQPSEEPTPEGLSPLALFEKSLLGDSLDVPTDGYFVINSVDNKEGMQHYTLSATFYTNADRTGLARNAGLLKAGNLQSAGKPIGNGHFSYYENIRGTSYQNSFGKDLTYEVPGSADIPGFVQTMYVPKEVVLNHDAGFFVSKSQGTRLSWNSDSRNGFGVLMAVMYDGIESNLRNASLPVQDAIFYRFIPDTGQYQITSQDLAHVPSGGFANIYIIRGNAGLAQSSTGRKIHLLAYATSNERIVVQN
ncbi:MAG: hypothetical protein HC913_05075 [Microscillaceae bacterium]|nr:hypothetical protein [Microscillaceae bacterium]